MATWNHILTQEAASGGAANITFSSISNSYDHLVLRWIVRGEYTSNYDYVDMQINDDTNSGSYKYWRIYVRSGASSISSGLVTSADKWKDFLSFPGTPQDGWSGCEVWFPNYSNTYRGKVCFGRSGSNTLGTGSSAQITHAGGGTNHNQTNAITKIKLFTDSGNDFAEHSRFTLYGINADPA